jgi:hypothetical protein
MLSTSIRRSTLAGAALLGLLAALPAPAKDADSDALTRPGRYEDWNDNISSVEIKQTFRVADYAEVRVVLDTAATPLPDKDDNAYEPVKAVLERATETFVTGMKDELPAPPITTEPLRGSAAVPEAGGATVSRALAVRVRIVRLNPGSRSARFFGGFGAGKSSVEIEGEILDGTSNTVLLSFATQRSSGGMTKAFGGNYEKLMSGDVKDVGSDIGAMLALFK